MKLYLVWGIEFHSGRNLFGVYETMELACDRLDEMQFAHGNGYDDYRVEEITLNEHIDTV